MQECLNGEFVRVGQTQSLIQLLDTAGLMVIGVIGLLSIILYVAVSYLFNIFTYRLLAHLMIKNYSHEYLPLSFNPLLFSSSLFNLRTENDSWVAHKRWKSNICLSFCENVTS